MLFNLINKSIAKVSNTRKMIMASYRLLLGGDKSQFYMFYSNTQVYLNEDAVDANSAIYAVVGKNVLGIPIIAVSREFLDLDPVTQEFILEHEIGHVVHKHLNLPQREAMKNALRIECEADEYAAEKVGYEVSIKVLLNLHQKLEDMHYSRRSIKHMSERINHLVELQKKLERNVA